LLIDNQLKSAILLAGAVQQVGEVIAVYAIVVKALN